MNEACIYVKKICKVASEPDYKQEIEDLKYLLEQSAINYHYMKNLVIDGVKTITAKNKEIKELHSRIYKLTGGCTIE